MSWIGIKKKLRPERDRLIRAICKTNKSWSKIDLKL